MTLPMPERRCSALPHHSDPAADLRARMTGKFLARTRPSMTEQERDVFEERIAICMFDGGLTESESVRVAMVQIERSRREKR